MAHKNRTNRSPMQSQTGRHDRPSRRGHAKSQDNYSTFEARERFESAFSTHGNFQLTPEQLNQVVAFYFLLMQEQEHQNFTRLLKLKDIAIKHFVDCFMVSRLTPLQYPLLDIGTGPGFPGIPLKILAPHDRIILAEGVQKRVAFLKSAREQLKLAQLDIVGRNINRFFFYPVRGVITRAVEDVSNTLGNVTHSLQTGGEVYLMKGPNCDPEIKDAHQRWAEYYRLKSDVAYRLPETPHERRLLIYEKIKPSPLADLEALLAEEERLAEAMPGHS